MIILICFLSYILLQIFFVYEQHFLAESEVFKENSLHTWDTSSYNLLYKGVNDLKIQSKQDKILICAIIHVQLVILQILTSN